MTVSALVPDGFVVRFYCSASSTAFWPRRCPYAFPSTRRFWRLPGCSICSGASGFSCSPRSLTCPVRPNPPATIHFRGSASG